MGLKVNLLPSDTTVPYVAFLANGDADLVMLDAPQVFQAVNAKQPVAVVYEANQYAPESIGVPKESDIQSVADLKGKMVGLASDRDQVTTMVALDTVGMSIDDISTVVVGELARYWPRPFRTAPIPPMPAAPTTSPRSTPPASRCATSPRQCLGNPAIRSSCGRRARPRSAIVQRFLKAYAMATHAGILDTKTMAAICKKNVPEQWENIDIGSALLDFAVYKTNLIRTIKRGEPQPDVWARVQAPYIALKEIPGPLDPAGFLDASFIDGASNYETAEVKTAIGKWKEANKDILIP